MSRGILRHAVLAAAIVALSVTASLAVEPGEHLFVDVATKLPGWVLTSVPRANGVELTVLVPPGQTAKDWTDQVAVETFYGPPHGTAQELLTERFTQISRDCEDTAMGPVSPVIENGYDTAMRAVACTKIKKMDKGEVSLYKAWKGNDHMYLVARAWRGPPFDKAHVPVQPDVTLQWLAFVTSIVLCDTRDPHKPCPSTTVGILPKKQ